MRQTPRSETRKRQRPAYGQRKGIHQHVEHEIGAYTQQNEVASPECELELARKQGTRSEGTAHAIRHARDRSTYWQNGARGNCGARENPHPLRTYSQAGSGRRDARHADVVRHALVPPAQKLLNPSDSQHDIAGAISRRLEEIMTAVLDDHQVDPGLLVRLLDEYNDLPGLQLTAAQVSRLLAIDQRRGRLLLDDLVDCGFLRRDGALYIRAQT